MCISKWTLHVFFTLFPPFLGFCGYKVSDLPALAKHKRACLFIYLLLTQVLKVFSVYVL